MGQLPLNRTVFASLVDFGTFFAPRVHTAASAVSCRKMGDFKFRFTVTAALMGDDRHLLLLHRNRCYFK
jgi:hypothetical protein